MQSIIRTFVYFTVEIIHFVYFCSINGRYTCIMHILVYGYIFRGSNCHLHIEVSSQQGVPLK